MDWKKKSAEEIVRDLENMVKKIGEIPVSDEVLVSEIQFRELIRDCPPTPLGRYAPGGYICLCDTCKRGFVGAKRCRCCYTCASKEVGK